MPYFATWRAAFARCRDERPLWEILGLAIPVGTPWKQLRIGELKTLLALAVGDE